MMAENTNIPQLRFPEFDGVWIHKKLGDIASFTKGKGISKADIVENGKLECIRYGELYTHYSELIDKVKSRTNLDKNGLVLSDKNDVIIPASGETQIDIATASCVLRAGIALGGDLNIIKSKLNGIFLSYYLNNAKKNEIAELAQGISVVHLYSSQLKTIRINYPHPNEQQKIAIFLTAIDQRITILTQQKKKLEQYKNGVMQKLFSQELRFKDENGENFPQWEEMRLSEIATKESSNISAIGLSATEGQFKIYGATGYLRNVDFYRENESYISIVKDGAGVGRTLLCEPKSSVLGTLDIIKVKKNQNLYFLYLIINRINFNQYITGSTIPHIYFKDYSREKIRIPCIAEQKKIATTLLGLDARIAIISVQIEGSKTFKQGLLQKMFV